MDQGSAPLGITYLATVPKIATDPTLSKFNDRARVNEVLSLPEVV